MFLPEASVLPLPYGTQQTTTELPDEMLEDTEAGSNGKRGAPVLDASGGCST